VWEQTRPLRRQRPLNNVQRRLDHPQGTEDPRQGYDPPPFPPTLIKGAFSFPFITRGQIALSATRKPSTPITRLWGSTTAMESSATPIPLG
jgi:hypothetical protein